MHYVLFKNTNNTLTMRGRITKFSNMFLMIFVVDALIVSLIRSDVIPHDMQLFILSETQKQAKFEISRIPTMQILRNGAQAYSSRILNGQTQMNSISISIYNNGYLQIMNIYKSLLPVRSLVNIRYCTVICIVSSCNFFTTLLSLIGYQPCNQF